MKIHGSCWVARIVWLRNMWTCVSLGRFWQRSSVQLWFHLNIVTMERAHHLNHYRQKIWNIFRLSRHSLTWPFSVSAIRLVLFNQYECKIHFSVRVLAVSKSDSVSYVFCFSCIFSSWILFQICNQAALCFEWTFFFQVCTVHAFSSLYRV